MKCPYCSSFESKVIDKRETENNELTRRRRECLSCQKRYTTYERVEQINIIVVKKDGVRQQFNKDKILNGLIRACEKRSVSLETLKQTVEEIESEIRNDGFNEVATVYIGEKVMDKLKLIDDIAYVRFASVYRDFADLTSFEKELKKILKTKKQLIDGGKVA